MKMNVARMMTRSKMAVVAVLGVMALGAWTGVSAQVPEWSYDHSTDGLPIGTGATEWTRFGSGNNWEVNANGNATIVTGGSAMTPSFLINNYNSQDDGVYTVTFRRIHTEGQSPALGGGIVFRYNSPSQYYYLALQSDGWGPGGVIALYRNNTPIPNSSNKTLETMSTLAGYIDGALIPDNDLPMSTEYKIKIDIDGNTFTVKNANSNDKVLATFTDNTAESITSGKVGYMARATWNATTLFIGFVSSSWEDKIKPPVTIPVGYMAWNKTAGVVITPGSGDWTDITWSSGNSSLPLGSWVAGSNALFAGADATGTTAYTIAGTESQTVGNMDFRSAGYVISAPLNFGSAVRTVTVDNLKSATISSVITNSAGGGVTKAGPGTLTLSGTNTYTGATNITAGNLIVSNNRALGNTAGATVNVSSGASLHLSGGRTVSNRALSLNGGTSPSLVSAVGTGNIWDSTVALTGANTIETNSALTIGGIISGAGTITKTGTDTLTLTANNTYTGATSVNGGGLRIGSGGTTGAVTGGIAASGTGTRIIFDRSNDFTYNGIISSTGGLIKRGAGMVTLTGANTYGGTTVINGGTLRIENNSNRFSISDASAVTINNGGTLDVTTSSVVSLAYGGRITNNPGGALLFSTGNNPMSYTGILDGSGTVSKTGTGTLSFTGQHPAMGSLNIGGGGTVLVESTGSGAFYATDSIVLAAGTPTARTTLGGTSLVSAGDIVLNNNTTLTGRRYFISNAITVPSTATDASISPVTNISVTGRVNLDGGTIYLGGGRGGTDTIQDFRMGPRATMNYRDLNNRGSGTYDLRLEILVLNGTLDVTMSEESIVDGVELGLEYYIAAYTGSLDGAFDTIKVNGISQTVGAPRPDGLHFKVESRDNDGFKYIALVIEGENAAGKVKNYLSVVSASLIAENANQTADSSMVELVISGMNSVRANISADSSAHIMSAGIWYRSNQFAASASTTDTGVIPIALNYPGFLPAAGDIATVRILVPKHPSIPAGSGVGAADPFYYFNANLFWSVSNVSPFVNSTQNMGQNHGASAFMRDPKNVILPNNLQITTNKLDTADSFQKIELVITGHSALPGTVAEYKPYVDSVGVWLSFSNAKTPSLPAVAFPRPGNRAVGLHGADSVLTFARGSMGTGAAGFRCTVNVPLPAAGEDTLTVTVAPRWVHDSIPGPISELAGSVKKVILYPPGVEPPPNAVSLTGQQFVGTGVNRIEDPRTDTVTVTVVGLEPPRSTVEYEDTVSISLAFTLAALSGSPSGWIVPEIRRSVSQFTANNIFNLINDRFAGELCTVHYSIKVEDSERRHLPSVTGSFAAGRPRPAPLANLRVEPGSSSRDVRLRWDRVNQTEERLKDGYIFIRHSDAPLSSLTGAQADTAKFSIAVRVSDGAVITGGSSSGGLGALRESDTSINIIMKSSTDITTTKYWFQGVVRDSAFKADPHQNWSLASGAQTQLCTLTVDPGANVVVENIVKIDTVIFHDDDHDEMGFWVRYSLVRNNIGNEYSYGYVVSLNSDDMTKPPVKDVVKIEKSLAGEKDSFYVDMNKADLMYDTSYYVIMYTYRDDYWSGKTPEATKAAAVGEFSRQVVTVSRNDTARANNNRIIIAADKWEISSPIDGAEIRRIDTIGAAVDGFIYVSPGYRFDTKIPASTPELLSGRNIFSVSIKTDSIPDGYSMEHVRLYYWNSQRGWWEVAGDGYAHNNPESGWLTASGLPISAGSISTPIYRLMVDTQKPLAKKLIRRNGGQTDTVPLSGKLLSKLTGDDIYPGFADTFFIDKRNVGNVKATLEYGTANNELPKFSVPGRALSANSRPSSYEFTIGAGLLQTLNDQEQMSSFGLRVFLVIEDGSHTTRVDVSRQVQIQNNQNNGYLNHVVSEPRKWTPIAAQALLDSAAQSTKDILKRFAADSSNFEYDNTMFRLFRYHNNGWVEYGNAADSVFSLEPGRLLWLKTEKGSPTINMGPGYSYPMADTLFEVRLLPRQWVDFMLPYRFDITLGDIFDSTGVANSKNVEPYHERLQIYRWVESG
ncbi:MAG: autotransporter-associated beta strand repeat-containing protein, partial [Chitinispirillales bacterium]|nr:autotransporter-associated beta strand repeat-containing protein [Chitinispirillales bacterium]